MAQFSLDGYETVKQRKNKFKKDWKDGVIIVNLITPPELLNKEACFKSSIWRDRAEYQKGLPPDSTGHAYENSGMQGASKTSWVENAEESAIGRALDNFGYHGGDKCSKEEIDKVNRATGKKPKEDRDNPDPATENQQKYVADLIRTLYPLQSQQDKVMMDEIGVVKPIEDLTYDEAHDLITRLKKDKEKEIRETKKTEEEPEEDEPFIPKEKVDPQAQMRAIDATIKNLGIPPEKFREKLIQIYKTEKVGELSFDQKADVIRDLNSGEFGKK